MSARSSTILINPRYDSLVRRHGLDDFDRVMSWRGGQKIGRHAKRDIEQIDVDEEGRNVRLLVKREWQTYLKDRVRNWLDGLGWGTKARREWQALRALAEADIGCAEPVVVAERNGWRPQGYLVLREIPDAVSLGTYLAHQPTMSLNERRQLAAHLGREVGRLHAVGINHPDLFSKHVLLTSRSEWGQMPRVSFIDLQRSSSRRTVSGSQRVRDLAALDATLPSELASSTDRLAFLHSYLSFGPSSLETHRLAALVRRRSRVLQSRRKIRQMCETGRHAALALRESEKSL